MSCCYFPHRQCPTDYSLLYCRQQIKHMSKINNIKWQQFTHCSLYIYIYIYKRLLLIRRSKSKYWIGLQMISNMVFSFFIIIISYNCMTWVLDFYVRFRQFEWANLVNDDKNLNTKLEIICRQIHLYIYIYIYIYICSPYWKTICICFINYRIYSLLFLKPFLEIFFWCFLFFSNVKWFF